MIMKPNEQPSNIKPCPFCGFAAVQKHGKVKCPNFRCKVQPKTAATYVKGFEQNAIDEWNYRIHWRGEDPLVSALIQLSECDLNDNNCAGFEVANKRIRNIAIAALQQYKEGSK